MFIENLFPLPPSVSIQHAQKVIISKIRGLIFFSASWERWRRQSLPFKIYRPRASPTGHVLMELGQLFQLLMPTQTWACLEREKNTDSDVLVMRERNGNKERERGRERERGPGMSRMYDK